MVHKIERTGVQPGDYKEWASETQAMSMPGYWNGKDDDGDLLPPGIYIYEVELDVDAGDQKASGTVIVAY